MQLAPGPPTMRPDATLQVTASYPPQTAVIYGLNGMSCLALLRNPWSNVTSVARFDCERTEQELVQSFMSGKALLPFAATLISFAHFSRASSVRGGSPAVSIDLKTA